MEEDLKQQLFYIYFRNWVDLYKRGAVREVTLKKYEISVCWVKKLAPELRMCDITRQSYQLLINKYAETHEIQTVKDFNTQVRACLSDALDEKILERDPTRKIVIKGCAPVRRKKQKYLNQFELHTLLDGLNYGEQPDWEWLIFLTAKTGMRFSEAIAITPKDFDFKNQTISISKTLDYKHDGGFAPTKNKSSVRKIRIDWQTVVKFSQLVEGLNPEKPIFVKEGKKIYSTTANDVLGRYCKRLSLPIISFHGLRHTHASLMLYSGASIASVARRLGHANMTTTQKTYLHIIQELENQDVDVMMRALSAI